jgi:hypothetical protein
LLVAVGVVTITAAVALAVEVPEDIDVAFKAKRLAVRALLNLGLLSP